MKNNPKVSLDADLAGELAITICDYLNRERTVLEIIVYELGLPEKVKAYLQELVDTFYLAGNIEGRILSDNATVTDLELVDLWDDELCEREVEYR